MKCKQGEQRQQPTSVWLFSWMSSQACSPGLQPLGPGRNQGHQHKVALPPWSFVITANLED